MNEDKVGKPEFAEFAIMKILKLSWPQFGVFLAVLLIVGWIPVLPVAGIPPITLRVVDKQNMPIAGVEVKQDWQNWTYESEDKVETAISDADGYVHFPERRIRVSFYGFVIWTPLSVLSAINPHASTGPHSSFSSAGAYSYESYRPGQPLPETLVIKRDR